MYNGVILRERMILTMLVTKIVLIVVGIFAVLLSFKADFVAERILHKENDPKAIMRVKYVALALAVVVCIVAFTVR